jgi:hypothetical protein
VWRLLQLLLVWRLLQLLLVCRLLPLLLACRLLPLLLQLQPPRAAKHASGGQQGSGPLQGRQQQRLARPAAQLVAAAPQMPAVPVAQQHQRLLLHPGA